MTLSPRDKTHVKIAASLGIIQGLSWTIMSLICLVEYYMAQPPYDDGFDKSSYVKLYNLQLYSNFLYKYNNGYYGYNMIVLPNIFAVFTWIEFCGNSVWLAISLIQICVINSQKSSILNINKSWSAIIWFLSILDFVFIILLATDLHTCTYQIYDPATEGACIQIYVPVIVIVAKGFTLWIVNLVFSVVLFKISNSPQHKNLANRPINTEPQVPQNRNQYQNPSNTYNNGNNMYNGAYSQAGYNNNNNEWNSPYGAGNGAARPPQPGYYNDQQHHGRRY